MTRLRKTEALAFILLFGLIAYYWARLVPPPLGEADYLLNPANFAMIGATQFAVIYFLISVSVANSLAWRRILLALFLASMPMIYFWAAIRLSDQHAILVESLGMLIFIAWAVLAYRRSLFMLGVGIAIHGIAWDAWHHHSAAYIEPWYPMGCLLVDLALFFVVAAQQLRADGPQKMASGEISSGP